MSYESLIAILQEKLTDDQHLTARKHLRQMVNLLQELRERQVPIESLKEPIGRLEIILNSNKIRYAQLRAVKTDIFSIIKKEFGILSPGHYQSQWALLGMIVFGLPLSIALDNNAFFALGLPIGFGIGAAKDKKAKAEGKMLTSV